MSSLVLLPVKRQQCRLFSRSRRYNTFERVNYTSLIHATMSSEKIIRDPVHDLIRIDCPHVLKLIETKPFQRLRKIRQLGLAYLVYPGAEHSRFIHSLGAHHIARKMVDVLRGLDNLETPAKTQASMKTGKTKKPALVEEKLEQSDITAVGIAALCHDIGHGPFSHLFEHVVKKAIPENPPDHEYWTSQILQKHPEVSKILKEAGPGILDTVVQIISHTYEKKFVVDIVSSQLDADRFDYLLRDSLMTGVDYGNLDLAWILRTIKFGSLDKDNVTKKLLAIDGKRGLSSVENYIIGRLHMYKHVYYHRTIRAAEFMLRNILVRAMELFKSEKLEAPYAAFESLAKGKLPKLEDYLALNDFTILTMIEKWALKCDDKILHDLSKRLTERQIFASITVSAMDWGTGALTEETKRFLKKQKLDPNFYLIMDEASNIAFKDYYYDARRGKEDEHQELFYLDEKRRTCTLSSSTSFVARSDDSLTFKETRIYIPKEHKEEIAKIWTKKK